MGKFCSKIEEERKTRINIIKDDDIDNDLEQRENERVFPGNANYFNTDKLNIIGQQKDNFNTDKFNII